MWLELRSPCAPLASSHRVPGRDYITLKGVIVANVATHWAPPTEFQPGAVGPNGGVGWVIEDNAVMYSRGLGVSIGLPTEGFSRRDNGEHVIRNNVFLRNGQGGVAGQAWNHNTIVEGNWIEDTNYREEFGGWETAGLKFHNVENMLIANNVIVGVRSHDPQNGAAHGIWIDFQNTQARLTGNVIADVDAAAVLTEANWEGPVLIDNNIMFDGGLNTYSSINDAWVNNLFVDSMGNWVNQEWQDRPPVSNCRWERNIFVGLGLEELPENTPDCAPGENLYVGEDALPSALDENPILSDAEPSITLERFDAPKVALHVQGFPTLESADLESDLTFEELGVNLQSSDIVDMSLNQDMTGQSRKDATNRLSVP